MTLTADSRPSDADGQCGELIAIIGMAARLPGARTVDEFRQNLLKGVESMTYFDARQLREAGISEQDINHPNYVPAAPIVDDAELFDADIFGLNAREAELLDPQFRLFMEVCHSALQNAGLDPAQFPGRVGVYAGSVASSYLKDNVAKNSAIMRASGTLMAEISNHTDYLSTGLAYRLGLTGPAMSIVTACSTALVAVHSGVRALRNRECEAVLAGGVALDMPQACGYLYNDGGILSSDGHVRAFDAKASGTVFGSGCGMVVLKPLDQALADGDTVHAVIRGSAVNNDGNRKNGFFAPSASGQAAVLSAALADAHVDPANIGYVEAHGTATLVGDPVEVSALTQVFGPHAGRRERCVISSVKSNVGHLSAAAGVAGLINAAFSVRDGVLAPSINFDEPNPTINFTDSPFYVSTALQQWEDPDGLRRALVNSSGIGGTNASIVIEQPPATEPAPAAPRPYQLLTLSAQTPTALDATAEDLAGHLAGHAGSLADVACTLSRGRRAMGVRGIAVSTDTAGAIERLSTGLPHYSGRAKRSTIFLFPGQGAQYPGMAREFYELEPVFRAEIDRCAAVLAESHGIDLVDLLFTADAGTLEQTANTQPALFAVEYALAVLLRALGLEPSAMAGHSVGEYVAATLAGVFDPDDALRLVADRGALMQSGGSGGAMLAVMLPEDLLGSFLTGSLDVAALNAPGICVVSGGREDIDLLEDGLSVQGIGCRRLRTSCAFHSRMMDPVVDEFRQRAAAVRMRPPRIPYVSNLTGTWIQPDEAVDAGYWARHLRGCVRFSATIGLLTGTDAPVCVEAGPGRTMTDLVAAHGREKLVVPTMHHPQQRRPDLELLLEAVGRVWAEGGEVDWERFWGGQRRRKVALPEYPYERRRYWIEPDAPQEAAHDAADDAPFSIPAWREAAPVTPGTAAGVWVVLAAPGDTALARLTELAAAEGAEVVQASGDTNPADVFRDIAAGAPEKVTMVHALAAGSRPAGVTEAEYAQSWIDAGFHSALDGLQNASRQLPSTPVDLVLVTTNMQDVTGSGQIEPAKAMLLGLVKNVPNEFDTVTCRSVDFAAGAAPEVTARQLFGEITSGAFAEQVAYRGRKRWTLTHTGVMVTTPDGVPATLKERGVYLITGGLGGIGLVLAEHLARLVRARVVLVGVHGLPDRAGWPALLAAAEDEALISRIRGVQAVEAAGGEVLVQEADVTDEAGMRRVRAGAEAAFGAVDGVFHLAAVAGGGMLETRSIRDAQRVLAPKVHGAYVLDRVFAPDLLVLYSSIAAVFGVFGLGDYAGANAVLDAFAQARSSEGRHVVSVCWPEFADVGMAIKTASPEILTQITLDGAAVSQTRQVSHPLLRNRHDHPGGSVTFDVDLSPGVWVLSEHRLAGKPTLPATGIIELIRAACADITGLPGAEIGDLFFLRPITAAAAPVQLEVTEAEGRFSVRLTDSHGREYSRGWVRASAPPPAPVHDLAQLRGQCPADETPDFDGREGELEFGERWHVIGSRFAGPGLEMVEVVLPGKLGADLDDYYLHPAMLDWCVGLGQLLREGDSWLPFSCDKMVIRGPLPARVYSIIRHNDDASGDVCSADITVTDASGAELVSIERFVMTQRARFASLMPAPSAPDSPPGAPAGQAGSSYPTPSAGAKITAAAGMDALRAVLASDVGPDVIWSPEGLGVIRRRYARLTKEALVAQMTAATGATSVARQALSQPYVGPSTDTERVLAELWADTLGVERVGLDDEFAELGGNSLFAVQLIRRIAERFAVGASVALLFDSPTIRTLAVAIEDIRSAEPAGEDLPAGPGTQHPARAKA